MRPRQKPGRIHQAHRASCAGRNIRAMLGERDRWSIAKPAALQSEPAKSESTKSEPANKKEGRHAKMGLFTDRRVIIVGTSGSIGWDVAQACAAEGAQVVCNPNSLQRQATEQEQAAPLADNERTVPEDGHEIGRASCRERVEFKRVGGS